MHFNSHRPLCRNAPLLTQAATHTGRSAEMHLHSHRPLCRNAPSLTQAATHTGRSAEMHLHSHRPRLTQAALQKCSFTHTGRGSHRLLCRNAPSLTQAEAHTGCSAEMHLHSHRPLCKPELTQAALQKCTLPEKGSVCDFLSGSGVCLPLDCTLSAEMGRVCLCRSTLQVLGSAYPWIARRLLK